MWDKLGLPRETNVPGQSLNYNQEPAFLHLVKFEDYLTLDAIYWRGGYFDREYGLRSHSVLRRIQSRYSEMRPRNEAERTAIFDSEVERLSMWYQLARRELMLDHSILAFETTRTKPFESVTLPNKQVLRQAAIDQGSSDPKIAFEARVTLMALTVGSGLRPEDQEAILGRPYYEITEGNLEQGEIDFIDISVEFITDTIISEALDAMRKLHVRPYHYWASQTELMIAAARPTEESGPWTRHDIERTSPMLEYIAGPDGGRTTFPWTNLRDYSNMVRDFYEPGYDRNDIMEEDQNLITLMRMSHPKLRETLEDQSWTPDDRELIKRLIRLARFGYGNAEARKASLERYRQRQLQLLEDGPYITRFGEWELTVWKEKGSASYFWKAELPTRTNYSGATFEGEAPTRESAQRAAYEKARITLLG